MGRRIRPNLPGTPFHITARVQNRERLFSGIERPIQRILVDAISMDRVQILAYAIMTNHLHLLVVQDRRPLGTLIQPILRRTALLVLRRKHHEGHVFERRFSDQACADPDYLRDCITYIHLNPVRAGICRGPGEYAWTSHRFYADAKPIDGTEPMSVLAEHGLRLFAATPFSGKAACAANYAEYVAWRNSMDSYIAAGGSPDSRQAPAAPSVFGGNAHWRQHFGSPLPRLICGNAAPPRADLLRIARQLLADTDPPATLELLRCGGRGRSLVKLRRRFVQRASLAGYDRRQIARFLRISPSTVSTATMPNPH
jgi:putative transposase